jgi:CubicO group peptidase (beta-lactamase class C family)
LKIKNDLSTYIENNLPHIRSVIISTNNKIVYENYFQGLSIDSYHHCASITKSFTAAIFGNALQNGLFKSIDDKVIKYLPKNKLIKSYINDISINHLLQMTAGFNWIERNSDLWDKDENLVSTIMDLKFINKPGSAFYYNTASIHLLSAMISHTAGISLLSYADRYLFKALGVQCGNWPTDLQGNQYGGHSAHFRTRDLLKLGMLYQNKGIWNGTSYIPPEFIEKSITVNNDGGAPELCKYGKLWWITDKNNFPAYFASGFGGQYIYNIDKLGVIVVITSARDKPHFENRQFIENYILPELYYKV